jgi:mono/diheme cytochrome c family protein
MPAFRDTISSDERWDVVFFVWRFSTNAETLALGEQIYSINCAACHGEDGTGTVLGSSDFTDLRLVDSLAPRDFYLIVTQGKGSMPAWQGRLSQDERWAVIDFLRTFSYDPALPAEANIPLPTVSAVEVACDPSYSLEKNPFAWEDNDAVITGELLYRQDCVMCHGADGAGSLPGTSDFTSDQIQNELRTKSGGFLCVVAEGRNAMPGWKETLSNEQMWQVLTYVANLGK